MVGRNNRTFLLEDIMIRDMVATAGGVKLEWPDDYGLSSEEYMAKVFGSGYEARTPVCFATTVAPRSLQDVRLHLRLEGLVYRVVAEAGAEQTDLARSRYLVDSVYRMQSIFDPRVRKDENTNGLLLTYAATFMGMANEYRRRNRPQDAEHVLDLATRLELSRERRMTVLYHFTNAALDNGHFDRALAALDTIRALGFKQPEFALRRGIAYEATQNLAQAESAYLEAVAADPSRGDFVQALVRFYLDKLRDTAKGRARLEDWLRRVPSDSEAARQLRTLS